MSHRDHPDNRPRDPPHHDEGHRQQRRARGGDQILHDHRRRRRDDIVDSEHCVVIDEYVCGDEDKRSRSRSPRTSGPKLVDVANKEINDTVNNDKHEKNDDDLKNKEKDAREVDPVTKTLRFLNENNRSNTANSSNNAESCSKESDANTFTNWSEESQTKCDERVKMSAEKAEQLRMRRLFLREHGQVQVVAPSMLKHWSEVHPTSALHEICANFGLDAPKYEDAFSFGPPLAKRLFIVKVRVNGAWFQPTVAAESRKEARALASCVALQQLGFLAKDPNHPL